MSGTLNVSKMKCVMYFRMVMTYTSATVSKTSSVPDTTVDRLNSEAARVGATTLCLIGDGDIT